MGVFIKHLDKYKLLYELWSYAKFSMHFYYCIHLAPKLNLDQVKIDINDLYERKEKLIFTVYYGRLLHVDITGDYLDTYEYNKYNGKGNAECIINSLKKDELFLTACKYYKSF
jgi:hypothetical protein